jgi:chorismate mutase/prephenate dehydratase
MDLTKLRNQIDRIDEKLLALVNQRAWCALEVNALKTKKKLTTYSPEREAQILRRLKSLSKGPLAPEDIDLLFREILSICRSLRATVRVAYLGPQGTFTHLATIKKFGKKSELIAAESISDVFEIVERGEADYGVVPVENSIEGVINYTLDMFFDSNLKICDEVVMGISHSLLGLPRKNIKRLYSKAEVFPQCRKWISRHLPGVELIPTSSTAKAALTAKKDRAGACIGNRILAQLYGLNVLESCIEDSLSKITRFLVIAKADASASGHDKTSLLFSIKDRVGVLHDALASFKRYRINLTKIESRPSKRKPWEYYFFVDLQGHRGLPQIQKALKDLERHCVFLKILGSYPVER